ncbi:hypothetical protein DH2020_001947 [Rehmannia glutinosa]|uniref:Uncharacterized protein n=1 Tax=Rehmannia glutinosa TaxID=99300 RepID=A0ABR0XSW9_REHGL
MDNSAFIEIEIQEPTDVDQPDHHSRVNYTQQFSAIGQPDQWGLRGQGAQVISVLGPRKKQTLPNQGRNHSYSEEQKCAGGCPSPTCISAGTDLIENVTVTHLSSPSLDIAKINVKESIVPTWMTPIIQYLEHGVQLEDENEARTLRT